MHVPTSTHAEYMYIMCVYAHCTDSHTHRQTNSVMQYNFMCIFTLRTDCTGRLMPLDGSSSIAVSHGLHCPCSGKEGVCEITNIQLAEAVQHTQFHMATGACWLKERGFTCMR